jgi:hypothetical protein
MLYSSHISWSSPTTPTPLELYPALAFDRLFKDDVEKGQESVLDAVRQDASDFRKNLGSSDQRKLDEYLESVREVERRISRAGKRGELQGQKPVANQPTAKRPFQPWRPPSRHRLLHTIALLTHIFDATCVAVKRNCKFPKSHPCHHSLHNCSVLFH